MGLSFISQPPFQIRSLDAAPSPVWSMRTGRGRLAPLVPGFPRGRRESGRGGRAKALIGQLEARLLAPPRTPVAGTGVSFICAITGWMDSLALRGGSVAAELVLGAGIHRSVGLTAVSPPFFLCELIASLLHSSLVWWGSCTRR